MQSKVLRHSGSPCPPKSQVNRPTEKLMTTVFQYTLGVILVDFKQHHARNKSGTYVTTIKKLKEAEIKKIPLKDVRPINLIAIMNFHTRHFSQPR